MQCVGCCKEMYCHCALMLHVARSTLIPPAAMQQQQQKHRFSFTSVARYLNTTQAKVLRCQYRQGGATGEGIALHLNSRLAFVLVITLVLFFFIAHIKPFRWQPRTFPRFSCYIVTGQAERNWTSKGARA